MKQFMGDDFLLNTPTAEKIYHKFAETMPICDYHCHISPAQIAENKPYRSITEAWLGGDHYKWRLMRMAGVPERKVTGDASDFEKFEAYAAAVSLAIGNPLYHWTHLELSRYFGIDEPLTPNNARAIFDKCNDMLSENMRPQELIARSNVDLICTTDDPTDTLTHHESLRVTNESGAAILPAFRPDKAIAIHTDPFVPYIKKMAQVSNIEITSFDTLRAALASRMDYFAEHGCKLSDHSLEALTSGIYTDDAASKAFDKALQGGKVSEDEAHAFRTRMFVFLASEYARRGWTMQLHIGALRNVNNAAFKTIGVDSGFDVMNDRPIALELVTLLNQMLNQIGTLPRTILYSLNDKDNYTLSAIAGSLQKSGAESFVSQGPAWWYHDQLVGMEEHMRTLAAVSPLAQFVGMTTDSRSLLSYTRHEYFRRLLCDMIGDWVERGEYPYNEDALGKIVRDVCFNNAMRLFE